MAVRLEKCLVEHLVFPTVRLKAVYLALRKEYLKAAIQKYDEIDGILNS